MLLNRSELIDKYNIGKDISEECELNCWLKEEADKSFNIYIFSMQLQSNNMLNKNWNRFINNISVHFQSGLSKNIERWNIYTVFFVNEKINSELKYKIEQDKFSTRKLVFDNHRQGDNIFDLSIEERNTKIEEIICSKLFDIKIAEGNRMIGENFVQTIKVISPLYGEIVDKEINRIDKLKAFYEE
ncbi:MAG: hypothetical protein E7231_00060 [Cellulosilyticum sp.]|nr:hypothetical protein [Cellulosilyticum sp.]